MFHATDHSERFVKHPIDQGCHLSFHRLLTSAPQKLERALGKTYRGSILLKTPFDLALYPKLIWELQPRTILELGSYQGGSGLWFSDNMSVLCEKARGAQPDCYEAQLE